MDLVASEYPHVVCCRKNDGEMPSNVSPFDLRAGVNTLDVERLIRGDAYDKIDAVKRRR